MQLLTSYQLAKASADFPINPELDAALARLLKHNHEVTDCGVRIPDMGKDPYTDWERNEAFRFWRTCIIQLQRLGILEILPTANSRVSTYFLHNTPQKIQLRCLYNPNKFYRLTMPIARKRAVLANDGLCAYCGCKATVVDHILPVSKGGGNEAENLQPLCQPCNSAKRDKTEAEYFALIGRN